MQDKDEDVVMEENKLKVRCVGSCSNQEGMRDPDMTEFDIPWSLLEAGDKAVAFMADNPIIARVDCHADVDSKFYEDYFSFNDELPEGTVELDGQDFIEMTPEYSLESCIVTIDRHGDMSVEIPISDTNDYLWSHLGSLDELKQRFAAEFPDSAPKAKMGQVNRGNLRIQKTGINSNQDWTIDPDMVELLIPESFFSYAESCLEFMRQVPSTDVITTGDTDGFYYTLYRSVDSVGEGYVEDHDVTPEDVRVSPLDGQRYVPFEPDYCLAGMVVHVDRHGEITVDLPFDHSDHKAWFSIGNLSDLKAEFEQDPAEKQNSKPKMGM